MNKQEVVVKDEERVLMEGLLKKGRLPSWKARRIQSLLALDTGPCGLGFSDKEVSKAYGASLSCVQMWRRAAASKGVHSLLERKEPDMPRRARKLDGEGQARLAVLACSKPPEGRECWTLELLANGLIELKIVDEICKETVRRELKKTNSSLGR